MKVASLQHHSINWTIAAFLLLYVFVPNAYGGFYFVLASIVLYVVAFFLLKSIKIMQFNEILIVPDSLLLLMALIALSFTITLTINAAFFTPIGLSEIAKPFIFMALFSFGVNANLKFSLPEIKKTLVLVSKIIIAGQIIITIDQLFGSNVFSVIYDYGKTSTTVDVFTFMRSAGSLFNPNYFAWILLHCGITIFIFSRKTSRYLWVFLVLLLILLAGSKSTLGTFPLAFFIAAWIKGDRVIINRTNIYALLSVVFLIFAVYQFLITYPEIFPRLKILLLLLTGEDESGGGRFAIWDRAYTYFLSKDEGLVSWVFGMGPIAEFKVLDNGYLYMFFRNGIVGLLLHIILISYFFIMFYKFEDRELGALGFQYVFAGVLIELIGESFAGWSYSIHLFLLAGIAFSYKYRNEFAARDVNINIRTSSNI